MAELGGPQLKSGNVAFPAAEPPPLPVGGARPAAGPAPLPGIPVPGPREPRPDLPAHPDGFPPEKDLGLLGRSLVWMFGLLLFGGGLAGWFLLFGYAEQHFDTVLSMAERDAEAINPMAGTSWGGADAAELAFVSQQIGIDAELLGTTGNARTTMASAPVAERRQTWPDIQVAGIMKGTEADDARVMLNGVLVRVGDSYRNVQVVQVNDQAAALRFKDEVVWFYSGQGTAD